MFNLASLTKTVQHYALDGSMSNEQFLNEFLSPYIDVARIKQRNGSALYFDKVRTSKILNMKADVPQALREHLGRYGLRDSLARAYSDFMIDVLEPDCSSGLIADIINLCSGSNAKELAIKKRLSDYETDPCAFLSSALIEAIRANNVIVNKGVIWKRGKACLAWESGDLFAHGFGNRAKKSKGVVVIPVNSGFDMHVTRDYEDAAKPFVSESSVHGQWITRMAKCGVGEAELLARAQESLRLRGCSRAEGAVFPLGAVAVIEEGNAVYYLLAVSNFDGDNNAHVSREEIGDVLDSLISFYDKHGQGLDMFVPLIGTGLSRAGLSSEESFAAISSAVAGRGSNFAGKVTIVVEPSVASELGLGENDGVS